jgi:hypothetical protein
VAQVYNWKGFYNPTFKKLVTVPADTLQQYTGNYKLGNDTLMVKFMGSDLVLQQNSQPVNGYKMYFSDNSSFSVKEEPSAAFKVLRNAAGTVEALELKQGGAVMQLPKME